MIRKNPAAVALGRKGGASKSPAKAAAAKANAQKAGRPRTIPEAEALRLRAEWADPLPYVALTKVGQTEIRKWLRAVADTRNVPEPWYSDAEQAYLEAAPDRDAVIEMGGHSTKSGRPDTLRILPEWVEWRLPRA